MAAFGKIEIDFRVIPNGRYGPRALTAAGSTTVNTLYREVDDSISSLNQVRLSLVRINFTADVKIGLPKCFLFDPFVRFKIFNFDWRSVLLELVNFDFLNRDSVSTKLSVKRL